MRAVRSETPEPPELSAGDGEDVAEPFKPCRISATSPRRAVCCCRASARRGPIAGDSPSSSSSFALTGEQARRRIELSQSSRSARRQASSSSSECAGVREPEAVSSRQSREPREPRPAGISLKAPPPKIIEPSAKTAGGDIFQGCAGSKQDQIKKRTFWIPMHVCAGHRLDRTYKALESTATHLRGDLPPGRTALRPLHRRCASRQFARSSGGPPCDSCTRWSTVRDMGCVRGNS
jgi:hypothetical protein